MTSTADPVRRQRIADPDLDWSEVVDHALDAARVAADGSERLSLAKTLRRLAPDKTTEFDAGESRSEASAVFEQCLLELAGD